MKNTNTTRNIRRILTGSISAACTLAAIFATQHTNAATLVWDGNDDAAGFGTASGTWEAPTTGTTTAGWSTDTSGLTSINGNSVTTTTGDSINFGSGATGLGAGTITVSGTVDSGNMTFAAGSGAIVLSGGTINLAAAATITVNNASNTIESVLSGAATSLTKAGTGTLTLSGENTYDGATTINVGTLKLGAAGNGTNSALGTIAAGTSVTATGAALDLSGVTLSTAEALSIIGTGVGSAGALTNSGAAASYSGVVTIGTGGASIGGSGDITLSAGLATNANALTKVGAGTLTLGAASSRTGTVGISAGTLKVGANGAMGTSAAAVTVSATGAALDLNGVNYATASTLSLTGTGVGSTGALTNSGGAATYAGVVTIAAAGTSIGGSGDITLSAGLATTANAFTKVGAGTLTLSAASSRTGAVTISDGILKVATGSSLGTNAAAATVNGTGSLDLGGVNYTTTSALSLSGTGFGSIGALTNSGPAATYAGVVTIAAAGTSIGGSGDITLTPALAANANSFVKTGAGTLVLTAASTRTGAVSIDQGTLRLLNASAAGTSATVLTLNGGNLDLRSATTTFVNGLTMSSSGATVTINPASAGAGVIHLISGATSLGGGQTMVMSAGSLTTTNTAYGLTLSGNKTLTGDSTYTINGNGASGTGTLTFNTGTISTGGGTRVLTLNSGTNTGTVAISGAFTGSAGILELAGTIPTVTVGALTGTANAVRLSGSGVYTSNGASTFTGGLSLNNGTLVLGVATVVTTGTLTSSPVGTGTFQVGTASQAVTLRTDVTNATTRTVSNAISLNNDVTFTTSAATGRIALNVMNGLTVPNTITLTRTNQLSAASTMTVDLIGAIGDGGNNFGLTFTGGGTWNIGNTTTPESVANTYTGLTTVNAGLVTLNKALNVDAIAGDLTISGTGTVQLGANNGNINNASIVTVSTGGTLAMSGRAETIGTLILDGGTVSTTTGTLTGSNTFDLRAGTVSSALAGSVAAAKTTAGTVTLSGTNTFNGGVTLTLGTLNINSATALGATAGAFTINGGTIDQTVASVTLTNNNAITLGGSFAYTGTNNLNLGTGAITNAGDRTITLNGTAKTLTMGGTMTNTSGAIQTTTVNGAGNTLSIGGYALSNSASDYVNVINGTGNVNITGAVVNGGTSTASGLTYGGSGKLTLSGTNTYAGNTLVSGGTMQFTNQVSLYNNGATPWTNTNINVDSGATMAFNMGGAGQFTRANIITLLGLSNGANGFKTGSILGLDTTGGNVTFDGVIANPNGGTNVLNLNKLGTNTLTLNQVNTYTGDTTISAGTLQISGSGSLGSGTYAGTIANTGALQYSSSASQTFSGAINGAAGALTKDTSLTSTLTLTSANGYTGATTVNAGTLDLGGGGATGSLASTVLNLGGGTFAYTRNDSATQAFTTTNINAGASAITAATGDTLTLGALTKAAATAGTVNFGTTGSITTTTNTTNGIIGGYATFGGTTWAVSQVSGGPVAITGLGTYTLTSVAGTTAGNYTNNNIDVDNSAGTIGAAITPNTLRFNTAAATTVALAATGANVVNSGGILVTSNVGNNLSVISGASTLAGASGGNLSITQNNTSNSLRIDSVIANNGTSGLVKSGAGTVILTNANTYTGATTINAGTLQLGNGGTTGTLATGSAITVAAGGNLAFNYSGATTVLQGTGFSNTINGAGSVTLTSGTVQFGSATNTYTGGFILNGGTVWAAGNSAAFGTGTLTINSGAIDSKSSGGASGSSPLTTSVPNIWAGNFQLNSSVSNGTWTNNGNIALSGGTRTVTGGSYTFNLNGVISEASAGLGVIFNTFTAVNMSAVNTFTGGLTIGTAFPLTISGSGSLGSGNYAGAISNVGTFNYSSSADQIFSGAITGAAGILNKNTSATSKLTLSGAGANTYSGLTTVSAGTLELAKSANNAIAGGGLTIGAANNTAATVQYTGASGDMMGAGAVTINGRGILDFNGGTDTIGAVTIVSTGATGSNPTPIINTAGNGNLTIGALGITPVAGFTTVVNAGTGTGTITLGGDVTFTAAGTGRAQITGTTLALGAANRTFTIGLGTGANQDLLIDAGISGARSLTKAGTGRLTFTGTNSYTLGTTVNVGTLQIGDGTTAGTMAPLGALTMGGGSFVVRGPASGGSSQTVGSLATTAATSSTITLTPGASGNTTLTITSGTLSTGVGSALNFNYTAGTTVGGTVGNNYVVWNPTLTGGIIGAAYSVTDSGGLGFATTSGGNVVRLTDPGSAGLPVSGGSATGSYFVNSSYSTVSTSTPGSLVEALSGAVAASNVTVDTTGLASGANLALGTNLLTLGAGMAFNGPNPYEITGSGAGGLRAASAGGTIFLNNASTSTVTISAPIVNNTASLLTIDGTGTTILGGANTYTGATTLNGGTTRFSGTMGASAVTINNDAVAQIGAATGLTSSNTVTFGPNATGSLQLLGNNVTIGNLSNNATLGTPVITNNNGGPSVGNATLTINSASNVAFAGVLQDGTGGGTLSLIKSGAGQYSPTGVNTYTGTTSISGGQLNTTLDSQLGSGGTLIVTGSMTWNMGAAVLITYNRGLTVSSGTLTLNSGNSGKTVTGVLAGSGGIVGGNSTGYIFTNTGNTFTGTVNNGYQMLFASLGDSSNAVNLTGSNSEFQWTGGAKTFALRPFTLNDTTASTGQAWAGYINSNGSGPLTILQNLAFSGAAGARTLRLGASAGSGANVFAGNIANYGASAVGITKDGAGAWTISGNMSHTGGITFGGGTLTLAGTNTYSGATNFNAAGITLIFAGTQAVSPNSTYVMNTNGSTSNSAVKLLDDGSGTVTAPSTFTIQNSNAPGNNHDFTVGNNNTANGGTSSGTTTGSTIAIGTLNWGSYAAGTTAYGPINILGTNGYRLQINSVVLHNAANLTSNTVGSTVFNPTTANVTFGTVTVGTGNVNLGIQNLTLDGTTSDNRITGIISNASDFGTSNRALTLTKSNSSTWTLSGANTYTGTTSITGGNLIARSASALGTTSTANVSVSVGADLNYVAATDTSLNIGGTLTINGGASTVIGSSIGGSATSARIAVAGNALVPTAAVTVNVYGVSGASRLAGTNTYTLISGLGGGATTLNNGTYTLGTVFNNTDFTVAPTLTKSTTGVFIDVTKQTALTAAFWKGGLSGNTNVWAASNGSTLSNWTTTAGGAVQALTPGSGATVTISATSPTTAPTATVLGADMSIAGLAISDTTNGLGLNADGYTLTVGTGGITMDASVPASTIAANVAFGGDQTWTNNSANTLTVRGAISGSGNLIKDGTGRVTLTNSNTNPGTITVNAGTLQFTSQSSLYNNTPASWTAANINVKSAATLALNVDSDGSGGFTSASLNTLLGNISVANSATEGLQSGAILVFDTSTATGGTFTQGNLIADSTGANGGAIAVTKLGTGTLVFDKANTYGGATTITTGTLQLDGSTHSSSTVGVGTAGTLTGSGTVNGNATLTGSGVINKASGTIAGTLGVTGGFWNGAGAVTGLVTSSSGTFTIGSGANLTANGDLDVTGGSIAAGNSSSTITGSVDYTSSSNSTFAGIIAGSSKALTMNNAAATLTLSGINTYTGDTTVSSGTLLVSGSLSGSSAVTVQSGGTLGTSSGLTGGTVGAVTVQSGGTLAPGASTGLMNTGNLAIASGGIFATEINATGAAGTNYDQVSVTGTVDITGSTLSLSGSYLTTPSVTNDLFFILLNNDSDTITGTFANATLGDDSNYHVFAVNGQDYLISYQADFGGLSFTGGNDIALMAVPEPGAVVSLLGGLGLLLGVRRRRRE